MENPIIVLTGPTASGKTAMSLALAKKFNAEIICADSMTVYLGMDIGTDKPTKNKDFEIKKDGDGSFSINGIRHYLLDILNPDQEFNAAIFKKKVERVIDEIRKRQKIPMLVGGSLLYIDTFIYDFQAPDVPPDPKLRAELEKKPNKELFAELVSLDPDAEWTIDPNNRRRLIRALEVCLKSGQPFTTQKSKKNLPKNVLYLALKTERGKLYEKINQRVDQMMKEGFLDEVISLYKKYDHSTAMQATGYRQLVEHLEGKISLDEAVENTKKSHRNFAKRQMTWLRGNTDIVWIESQNEAVEKIEHFLAN